LSPKANVVGLLFLILGCAAAQPVITGGPVNAASYAPLGLPNTGIAHLPDLAAQIHVTTLDDNGAGSLRQAIADAASGGTIVFDVTGAIALSSELVVDKSLTISGPGAGSLAISGGGASRLELPGCAGTQSSRRLDSRTVEILRNCGSGESMRFVRRLTQPKELVLEITEQRPDGSRLERRLVLEKQ